MMLILQLKPFKHFVYREVCNISYGGGKKPRDSSKKQRTKGVCVSSFNQNLKRD